jgi:hypothetical protein
MESEDGGLVLCLELAVNDVVAFDGRAGSFPAEEYGRETIGAAYAVVRGGQRYS